MYDPDLVKWSETAAKLAREDAQRREYMAVQYRIARTLELIEQHLKEMKNGTT